MVRSETGSPPNITEEAAREAYLSMTPRCALPPEDEALLIAADRAGATADEKTGLIKHLCEKNGLPWLDDEPPSWSEKASE
jgi:hypothetical protein